MGFVFCVFFTLSIVSIKADVFTSVEAIRSVVQARLGIAAELKNYIEQETFRLGEVERMAEDLHRTRSLSVDQLVEFLNDPINAHYTIHKSQRESFQGVHNLLENTAVETVAREKLEALMKRLPTEDDVVGSAQAIHRLQDTYQLTPEAFASGRLPHVKTNNGSHLTAIDCFDIGKVAYLKENYQQAAMWFQEASNRLSSEMPLEAAEITRAVLLDFLSFSNYKIGEISKAAEQSERLIEAEPDNARAIRNARYFRYLLLNSDTMSKQQQNMTKDQQDLFDFKRLCRGEKTMIIKDEHKLYCDYATNNDPRLLIAPMKRETLHFDPWVFVYYNAITDDEINFLKKSAFSRLERAGVVGTAKTESRITKTGWVNSEDGDSPLLEKIHTRLSAMTQLSHYNVESFQVANYGIGGHYWPHRDYFDYRDINSEYNAATGNRITTVLFYMTDVPAGGGTAFPQLGVHVSAKKGMALIWFNLLKSGKPDDRTQHGACPVLFGIKWVATKWYRERTNELWQPCSVNESDPFSTQDLQGSPSTITHQRAHGRVHRSHMSFDNRDGKY